MKYLLPMVLALIMLSGCRTIYQDRIIENEVIRDSIQIKTEWLDREIIKSIPDSAAIRALFECDSLGNVYLSQLLEYEAGDQIKPQINVKDNGEVIFTAKVDSLAIFKEIYKKVSKEESLKSEITKQKDEIKEKDSRIQALTRICIIAGCVVLVLLIWLITKMVKK